MRILVVEDNRRFSQSLKEHIRKWGHGAEAVTTGREALQIIRQEQFDIVMIDVFLPDSNGGRLVHEVKAHCPGAGVIIMTGSLSRELEFEMRKKWILGYFRKPFKARDLRLLLENFSRKESDRGYSNPSFFSPVGPIDRPNLFKGQTALGPLELNSSVKSREQQVN